MIQEVSREWYKDASSGECFKVKVKAEVIPDEKGMARISKDEAVTDEPNVPLHVRMWMDKKEYKQQEKIKIYIKGNKPFYSRVLYQDAKGELIQLLPNPYRSSNYFNGGVVYEIPSGNDQFELEVSPPFGEEKVLVYASSSPLGDLILRAAGGVYQVKTEAKDVGEKTRGVKIWEKGNRKESGASEFYEGALTIKTGR